MPEPKFSASDADFAAAMRIDLDGCRQCAASKDMQKFYAGEHDKLVATIQSQVRALTAAERAREDADGEHWLQLHYARLLAFAGWFALAIGLVTRYWR